MLPISVFDKEADIREVIEINIVSIPNDREKVINEWLIDLV